MNVAGKLALVLAFILACAAVWKRFQGGLPAIGPASSQPVRVTGPVPLGPQRFLHLISIGGRQLLLGSTPQSISLLAALDESASLLGIPGINSLPPAPWAASPGEDGGLTDEESLVSGSTPKSGSKNCSCICGTSRPGRSTSPALPAQVTAGAGRAKVGSGQEIPSNGRMTATPRPRYRAME